MKRVFHMEKVFTYATREVLVPFCSPEGKTAACILFDDWPIIPGDKLIIHYAITDNPGGGGPGVRTRMPNGSYKTLYPFATVS